MPTRRLVTTGAAAALTLLLACDGGTAPAPTAEGIWGGQEASLTLTRDGGSLSYPCGAGTISAGWTFDGRSLTGTGQHFPGGGPAPQVGHPARYSGTVTGDVLVLSVTLTDLNQTLGPFHLQRGGAFVPETCF